MRTDITNVSHVAVREQENTFYVHEEIGMLKLCMRTDITNVSHEGINEQETLSTSEQCCSLIG